MALAFQSDDQWNGKFDAGSGGGNSIGDRGAIDDATEDIDENGLHLRIRQQQFERLFHLKDQIGSNRINNGQVNRVQLI